MPIPLTASETLNREFLEIRSRLLQLAATFDRIERAAGMVDDDPRMVKIRRALAVLSDGAPDRAEQLQMIFSRRYEENWRRELGVRQP